MKDKINILIEKISAEKDDKTYKKLNDFLISSLSAFSEYFGAAIKMENGIEFAKMRYGRDSEDYKFRYTELDKSRRIKHIALCDAINKINRLCDRYECERIFPLPEKCEGSLDGEKTEDRNMAIYLLMKFAGEMFNHRAEEAIKEFGNISLM